MKKYIGTKFINASPMTRLEYNQLRGWELPADENGDDAGYLVEYVDGGKANTEHYAGYVSWSPKEVFEKAYRLVSGLTFGMAIEVLKQGKKVARTGWNGKGMFIYLTPGSEVTKARDNALDAIIQSKGSCKINGHLDMKAADDSIVCGWLASQTDMLAEDWIVIE